MPRRGSVSLNRPKPSIGNFQGDRADSERRLSEPIYRHGMTSGGLVSSFRQPQAPVTSNLNNRQRAATFNPPVAHINSIQAEAVSPHQAQGQGFVVQAPSQPHSFVSSMDLITHSATDLQTVGNNIPLAKNYMFSSSSHHTSHTAAAGDLLSMSRRALEPARPTLNSNAVKKRTAMMTDENNDQHCQSDANTSNPTWEDFPQHQRQGLGPGQSFLQRHLSDSSVLQRPSAHIAFQSTTAALPCISSTDAAASVQLTDMAAANAHSYENDNSHQYHRTIRRCRRSDSFEMMDDGC